MIRRTAWLALALLALPGEPLKAMCAGGGGGPPRPGPSPYAIGDYVAWWGINRDDILLTVKSNPDPLQDYDQGPRPDKVTDLLALVGFEGDFCSIVKEIGLKRLRRHPKIGETLAGILKDARALPPHRAWAACALGDLKVRRAIPALKSCLGDPEGDVRGFSAAALGKMGDDEASLALVPLIRDAADDEFIRAMAVLSLAGSKVPDVRSALQSLARKEDSIRVRRSALMVLGVGADEAEKALLTATADDKEPYVRAAALIGLGFAGTGRETIARHLPTKAEPEAQVRSYAAVALGMLGDPAAAGDLIEVLEKDKDFSVKGYAALALGRCPTPKALEALEKVTRNRQLEFVQPYAAIGLGLTGKEEALAPLERGLMSKQFDVITASAAGLALLGFPEASKPLLKALDNRTHDIVREYAAVALGRLRAPETFPRLLACMEDRSPVVRHADALALAVFGNPEACPVLEKALQDKQEAVRLTASIAFDLLTDDDTKPLTLGERFKADPRGQTSRKVGPVELSRLLNRHAPPNFKLPLSP